MTTKKLLASTAAATVLAATALIGNAASAEAASCSFTMDTWATYNQTCSSARHWNKVDPPGWFNSKTYYAAWVGPWRTSSNYVCYAYNVSHGTNVYI